MPRGRPAKSSKSPVSSSNTSHQRLNSSKSSNSSYRDYSRNVDSESSPDSSQHDDSVDDDPVYQDSTDNASAYLSSPGGKSFNSSKESPYGRSIRELEGVKSAYYEDPEIDSFRLSPMAALHSPLQSPFDKTAGRKRFRSPDSRIYDGDGSDVSPGGYTYSHASPRGSIHTSQENYSEKHHISYKSDHSFVNERKCKNENINMDDKNNSVIFGGICMICLLFFTFFLYTFFFGPVIVIKDEMNLKGGYNAREALVTRFETSFKAAMGDFPNQADRFWLVLKSRTKRVMKDENPRTPAVLLLVANKGAFDTLDCIAIKFSSLVANAYDVGEPVKIDIDQLQNQEPGKLKLDLDQKLNSAFQKTKVVVVNNIDKIHGKAAMIFHSYCDNEFAPFKDAVIIFTMHIDSDRKLSSDSEIENYLESKWENELDKDRRSALIYSRIANSIAVVNAESDEHVKQMC